MSEIPAVYMVLGPPPSWEHDEQPVETEPCRVRWLGSVWKCDTHGTYIEDGNVCPESEA